MSARAAWRLESLGFERVYRYTAGKADWAAAGLPVEGELARVPRIGDIARRDVPKCRIDERLRDVRGRLDGSDWQECVVVNEHKVVLGLVRSDAFGSTELERRVEDVMDPGPVTYRPDTLVQEALHQMQGHGKERPKRVERVLVTTSDGELVGVLRLEDAERVGADQPSLAHTHG